MSKTIKSMMCLAVAVVVFFLVGMNAVVNVTVVVVVVVAVVNVP